LPRLSFHPPGKPEQSRTGHLVDLKTPTLIVQGTRDEFGSREEVLSYNLSPLIDILWLEDVDHDLKPRKRISGSSAADHLVTMADTTLTWSWRLKHPAGSRYEDGPRETPRAAPRKRK
jgi:predicted alpha/beta-hydrolase family hydrolase